MWFLSVAKRNAGEPFFTGSRIEVRSGQSSETPKAVPLRDGLVTINPESTEARRSSMALTLQCCRSSKTR